MNWLKKQLIPHADNDYKPHLLREFGVLVLSALVVVAFLAALLQGALLFNSDLIASILPGVLIDLANGDRNSSSLSQLKLNDTLTRAAQLKANDMAAKGYFAHYSPEGKSPWYWFDQAGYKFIYAGENLAVDFSDSGDVERAWMNSPGHRANILSGNFTEIGIAVARGTYGGRQTTFVVQMFGKPLPRVASASPLSGAKQPEIKTIKNTPTVAVVKNVKAVERTVATAPTTPTAPATLGEEAHATIAERVSVSPRQILRIVYWILGGLIALAIALHIGVELKKQHPKYIMYGVLLLGLILLLYTLSGSTVGRVLVL